MSNKQPIEIQDDLSTIFIRAYIDRKWGAYSLRWLLENNHGDWITRWYMEKMFHLASLVEGEKPKQFQVESMLKIMETFEPLVRANIKVEEPQKEEMEVPKQDLAF